jgi:hypothetical protein
MTGALPRPSRTGVRIAGDRFQWLCAWDACLRALHDSETGIANPVVRVGVEIDGAGNVDDVVLYRRLLPHTYAQVKYAVGYGTPVNTDYMTGSSISGGDSILQKLIDARRRLAGGGQAVDLVLVSNRLADPHDPLLAGRDARTQLLLPRAGEGGEGSAVGRTRRRWASSAGIDDDELLDLLGLLRLDLGRDVGHLEEVVSLRMRLAGLRGDTDAVNLGISWIADQVIAGRRELDLGVIREAIEERDLRAGSSRSLVSVATLVPDPMASTSICSIDWVDRFDGADAFAKRRPLAPATWADLQHEIESIPSHLGGMRQIAVSGSMRLAVAFEVGAVLRMVTGVDLAVVQRGELWASDAGFSVPKASDVSEVALDQGTEVAIVVEVSTPIAVDVQAFVRRARLPVRRLVVVRPDGGPRDNSVGNAEDAVAHAVGIRDTIRQAARRHDRVHLFLACPIGLALLLGHRWNRIAPTVVYEDLASLGYEAAFTVSA